MAAAYAALLSLMHTSELILHPSQRWLRIHAKQIESLLQKVRSLQEFLEGYSHRRHEEMTALERRITYTAYAAEDIIESHVSDQVLARSTGCEAKSSSCFSECIQKLIEDMEDLIVTQVMRIKENIEDLKEDRTFVEFWPASSSRLAPNEQNNLVGSDKKMIEVMESLTGHQSSRQVVTIVGMGGIGKTTLAKSVYENPYIVHHFHIRAWVTVSLNYSVRKIISALLSEIDQSKQGSVRSEDQSGELLYKRLFGTSYLIVMDALWGIELWDEISKFFPDNCNGSRVLITTRLLNVARQLNSSEIFEMEFLDDDQSWLLLRDKLFGKKSCPSELEELGKNIAKRCGGLPLAIVVIGGLLAKSDKTREFWEYVVENLSSLINSGDDENCQKILYLSYKNLPIHLKPCFLYIATNGTDWLYSLSYLIRVCVAEGFLKPIRGKSLEDVAYDYITELIDRNLIFLSHYEGIDGMSKLCDMHDLLRDLCLREAEKENFFTVIKNLYQHNPLERAFTRRLFCYQAPPLLFGPALLTRTIIGEFGWTLSLASSIRLLRVLDVDAEEIPPNGKEIMQLVNLRVMRVVGTWYSNSMWRFSSSISQFWSLQTLYFQDFSDNPFFLPLEIWDMPQLRHIHFNRVVLPNPTCSDNSQHESHILENLQTLSTVLNFRCTEEVIKRVPNLKKLEVTYDHLSSGVHWPFFCLSNLVYLHKLESLKFISFDPFSLEYLSFPLSLKELNLRGCRIAWEDMTIVGSLPYLEMLELLDRAFEGKRWCPIEGEFVRLKLLVIEELDLLHWRADRTHFPILEHLVLRDLHLEEVPLDFGEHPTLRQIELSSCSDYILTWAKKVREEQEGLGNEGLEVIVHVREDD